MKVVWVSDYSGRPDATGYSRASAACLKFLHSKGHEIHEVGVGYTGQRHPFPWKVYSTTAHGGRLEGQDVAPLVAQDVEADALILFMDVPDAAWAVTYVDKGGRALREDVTEALWHRNFALLLYAPIDGMRVDGSIPHPWPQILRGLNTFDALATTSKFGQRLMGEGAACIPHGFDPEMFKPMDRQQARARLGLDQERFTILYVATNKRRKTVPAFFEAISKFMERQPEAKVTAVFHGSDREDRHDIQGLADSYHLEERGVVVYRSGEPPLRDEGMIFLYNAADILWHPGNEGFGLPIIEAQACRIPVMVIDFSACPELVPDNELGFCKVPVQTLIPQPYNNIAWAWPDTDAAADRLAAFYTDKLLRTRLRRAAWEHAQYYRWDKVLPHLDRWLTAAVEKRKAADYHIRMEAVL